MTRLRSFASRRSSRTPPRRPSTSCRKRSPICPWAQSRSSSHPAMAKPPPRTTRRMSRSAR
eukprot:1441398-Alexandrium_andersonii.AAC.1